MITLISVVILMLLIAITLRSTANKYWTAFQWASWQEALQGAETGADIAMGELRKDATTSASPAFAGWSVNQSGTIKPIDSNGYWLDNSGGGSGNNVKFTVTALTSHKVTNVTYSTQLTPHAGEGNTNLSVSLTLDAPTSLVDPSGRQWIRVRAIGNTDLTGPKRVSEEKLDNRLRKLSIAFDRVLAATTTGSGHASRTIEVVAKPVTMFAGAIMTQCNFRNDKGAVSTNSFSSEDNVNWPYSALTGAYDMSKSDNPADPLGKNGDVGSNAFPTKHDHNSILALAGNTFYGDVGNNYSPITGLDVNYFTTKNIANPSPKLISANGNGVVSGAVSANFYRDLPSIKSPNWATSQITNTKVTQINGPGSYNVLSTDPNNPDMLKLSQINLASKDIFQLKPPPIPKGSVNTVVNSYVTLWVTGDIKLDDGGTVQVISTTPDANGNYAQVYATIYFEGDVKIGVTKETKTNAGGFDVQSDDAKNLIMLGVTKADSAKTADTYYDPVAGVTYTYSNNKHSGDIHFHENDFTGAIYAPDHNIVFDNTADGKGKRHKRVQAGHEYYGSFVGRTIHAKGPTKVHFDESLNDVGPIRDWGYVSWFEDVDVDNR